MDARSVAISVVLLVAAACGAPAAPPSPPPAPPPAAPRAAPAAAPAPAAAAAAPARCPPGTVLTRGPAEDEHVSGAEWCARPDGTRHGRYVAFWEPGKRSVEGDYAAGKRVGRWTRYFRHGEVVSEEPYRDGEPDGVWVAYSLRRSFAFATCFDRGRRVWQVSSDEVGEEEARRKPCP